KRASRHEIRPRQRGSALYATLSEYGESITARAAVCAAMGHDRASARRMSGRRGARSNETTRRPRARATSPIVPDPAIGSTTSSPGPEYRRTRFAAQPAGVTPLNEASPASGWPADWEGKSHVVYASRSVRPSIAHASAGTGDGGCEEVGAIIGFYAVMAYERRPEGEMCKSENLPREQRISGGPDRSLAVLDTASDDSASGAPRPRSRTEAIL